MYSYWPVLFLSMAYHRSLQDRTVLRTRQVNLTMKALPPRLWTWHRGEWAGRILLLYAANRKAGCQYTKTELVRHPHDMEGLDSGLSLPTMRILPCSSASSDSNAW